MTRPLKRVVIDHGQLLTDQGYFEERCEAALKHYVKQHGHGHLSETVIHSRDGSCCLIQPWKVTAARMRERISAIIKETSDEARRHQWAMCYLTKEG